MLEFFINNRKGIGVYEKKSSIQNIKIGIIAFVFDFGFSYISLPIFYWLYQFAIIKFDGFEILSFILFFILIDFEEYWVHRFFHEINIFWAAHSVHHQSNYFNLTIGLRSSFLVPIINVIFYFIFPLLGCKPEIMLLIIFVQGIYQLVIHTELIPKLGLLESIFVTPSIHRVHHGCNEIYIDKNYGKVFIFWDKIFNTYQPETEKVIYGIKDINSNKNIFNCLFDNYIDIYSVLNQKIAIKSKLKFLFNKPGNKL